MSAVEPCLGHNNDYQSACREDNLHNVDHRGGYINAAKCLGRFDSEEHTRLYEQGSDGDEPQLATLFLVVSETEVGDKEYEKFEDKECLGNHI